MRKPFFRPSRLTWFVKIDGKQVAIGKDPRYTEPPKENPKDLPPSLLKAYSQILQRQGEPEDRTLSFCIAEYLAALADYPPKTQYRAKHFLDLFLAATGDIKVARLKGHHVDAALKGRKWKPNTVHAFITRIEACLNHCVKKGWIAKNPLRGMTEKPTTERREEIMSPADRQRCIDAAPEPFKSALLFLAGTGVRPIELRFARVEKCDLAKGVILVRNKTRRKTGQQERPVFLSTAMTELCRRQIGERTEGWLFTNKFGGQWTQTAFEHRLQRLCGELGIIYGATLYSFRHGFASHAINDRRMNPAMVAIQLGHTDLKQLLKTYLHADTEAMRRALDE